MLHIATHPDCLKCLWTLRPHFGDSSGFRISLQLTFPHRYLILSEASWLKPKEVSRAQEPPVLGPYAVFGRPDPLAHICL